MAEVQETLKEATTPMVDIDTSGNAVDVELDAQNLTIIEDGNWSIYLKILIMFLNAQKN